MTMTMKEALHRISLASQNSMSSKDECGRIAREALAAEEESERKSWHDEHAEDLELRREQHEADGFVAEADRGHRRRARVSHRGTGAQRLPPRAGGETDGGFGGHRGDVDSPDDKGEAMTSRVSGFVVTLEKDLREDDAQEIANAISLLRGVTLVSPVESDPLADRLAHAEDVQNGDDAASRVAERVMREVRKDFEGVVASLQEKLNEKTRGLEAENERLRECSEARLAGLADRDRRLDQIAAAAARVQATVQRYFDQHGPSCDEHADEPDYTCLTCCTDSDASEAISLLKFWSKP
jgi:hypothetical protein